MEHPPVRRSRDTVTRGFTLVEVLVVLALLSILGVASVPLLTELTQRLSVRAVTGSFLAQLAHARSEAIKRNASVVLCSSADAARCADAGGWEQGWIVFHDANRNGVRDADEELLAHGPPLPAKLRFVGNNTVQRMVSFSAAGGTQTTTGAFQAGTLTLCTAAAGPTEGRLIVINAAGRARVQRVQLPSCE